MFSKFNLKQLLGIFVILLLIVLAVEVFDSKDKTNSSFNSNIVAVDQDNIGSFILYTKNKPEVPVTFTKNDDRWNFESEGISYNAAPDAINAILNQISTVKADRIVANSKDKWNEYKVSDSLATRVIINDKNGKELADLYIGKFSYSQPKNQGQNQYRQQQGTMTSFVRSGNSKEIYAVDGYLSMLFDRDIKYMRDPVIIKSNFNDWNKITVTAPSDSSFTLEKQGNTWLLNGQTTDSASVVTYLRDLQNVSSHNFFDDSVVSQPTYTMMIEGSGSMTNPIEIKGYTVDSKHIISTSENKNTYFESGTDKLFHKLFQSRPDVK
ncbi:DUF4340 domain-containing protein [Saccharicrinis sp. FJH62]|uniref:DUF4340 domain-containing protein n=1 Tax=Saccharicrinis sp. FJH62 TaxID=3344657 RepID=UPI0035D43BF3